MSKSETSNETASGASLSNAELETDDNGMEVLPSFVIESLPPEIRVQKMQNWINNLPFDALGLDHGLAVSVARGGAGPEVLCIEYFDRIAELKNALRDCIKIFDLQNELARPSDACVPPRPEYVDKLRDVVSNV